MFGVDQDVVDDVGEDEDDDDDDGFDRKEDIVQAIENEKMKIKQSGKYDYPSVLSSTPTIDLPQCNVFTDIIKEMRERYLLGMSILLQINTQVPVLAIAVFIISIAVKNFFSSKIDLNGTHYNKVFQNT